MERGAVPFEVVLGWRRPCVAVVVVVPFRLGQAPMRSFTLALDAEACRLGHDGEAVVLKLAEPSADAVAMRGSYFLLGISMRQVDVAVIAPLGIPLALEVYIEQARAM